MKKIDATPTWIGILPILIAAIRDGTPTAASSAEAELKRMALLADKYVEHQTPKVAKIRDQQHYASLKEAGVKPLTADLENFLRRGQQAQAAVDNEIPFDPPFRVVKRDD